MFCLPEVEIISDLVCDGEESSFDLIFTNGSSLNILSSDSLHLWDFGGSYSLINGNTTTTNVNILYDTCGVYDVSLVVTDDNGCLAYDTVEYTVACNSSTDLNISTIQDCVNDTVFLATSSINPQWSLSFENLSVFNNSFENQYSHFFYSS